eukprot:5533876-Amphidinium_carterae.1
MHSSESNDTPAIAVQVTSILGTYDAPAKTLRNSCTGMARKHSQRAGDLPRCMKRRRSMASFCLR